MKLRYSEEESLILKVLGNKIRSRRKELNLSQEKLAFACDLDRTYIGSVERGERNISFLNMTKILNSLNWSLSDLAQDYVDE